MSGFAHIWNLDDPNSWAAAGTDAHPRFEFTAACPAGHSVASVIIKIYTASAGGTADATYTLTGGTLSAALAAGYYDSAYGMKNKDQASSERWWTIEVTCSNGDTSGESTRTGFKVCWGQAKYDYSVPSGATSSGWQFESSPLASPSLTHAAFLFRASSSSTDSGAWSSSISTLTPNTHLHVLVRLSTDNAGTNPTLPDMTFSYLTAVSEPDQWTFSPAGDWFLDLGLYRYGTKSLKFIVDDASDRYAYPFRITDGDDIPVQPNTSYVFSAWVKTDGPLTSGCEVRLEICAAGSLTPLVQGTTLGDMYGDGPGATTDTSAYPEGWQRLHLRYTTGPGVNSLRPVIRYDNNGSGSGDAGWVDAAQIEEGVVVSSWHASQLSNASVRDAYGLMMDVQEGARGYFRASDGTTATLDDIIMAGAGGGGGGSGNLDGGVATSVYGGTTAVDGGGA